MVVDFGLVSAYHQSNDSEVVGAGVGDGGI